MLKATIVPDLVILPLLQSVHLPHHQVRFFTAARRSPRSAHQATTVQQIHSPQRTPAHYHLTPQGLRTVAHARRATTAHRPRRAQLPVQMVPTRLELQQAALSAPRTMTALQRPRQFLAQGPSGQLWASARAQLAQLVTIAQEMLPYHAPQDTSKMELSPVLLAQLVSTVMMLHQPLETLRLALMVIGLPVVRSPASSALQAMPALAAPRLSVMVMVNGPSPDKRHAAHTQKARSRPPYKLLSLRAALRVTILLATVVCVMFAKKETIVMAQPRPVAQRSAPRHQLLQAYAQTGVIAQTTTSAATESTSHLLIPAKIVPRARHVCYVVKRPLE